ncbi:MAG: hypothetical protein ACKO5M_03645 [Vulcanococcus sp.]
MSDALPPPTGSAVPPPPPPPATPPSGGTAGRAQPSDADIAAILARVDREHQSRFASQQAAPLAPWLKQGAIARLLFVLSGLMLIQNGLDGLRTRAVSSDSLIAANINNRGGQSMGLGVAMLALAAMPYPSRPEP